MVKANISYVALSLVHKIYLVESVIELGIQANLDSKLASDLVQTHQ